MNLWVALPISIQTKDNNNEAGTDNVSAFKWSIALDVVTDRAFSLCGKSPEQKEFF